MPAFDVTLDDGTVELGLMLYQDKTTRPEIRTSWQPASSGLTPITWNDWKNGFGFSQPGIVSDGYAYGLNVDPRSPGMVVPSGAVTEIDLTGLAGFSGMTNILDSFSLGGHYYLLAGRYMLKVLNGYSTVSVVADAGVGQRFLSATVARYAGTIYAWIGVTNGFARWDGTTLTTTTSFARNQLANVYWATTDGVSVQRLVGADVSGQNVYHCPLTSDPMTLGNWSSAITIGDGAYTVTDIVSTGRHVYLMSNGGPYDVDDLGQTVNLAPYHQDSFSIWSGLVGYYWDGNLLFAASTGIDGIDIRQPGIKQGIANWVLPGASVGIPNETQLWGRPTAFTNDAGWVVTSLHTGVDSHIIYGKQRERLGFPGPGEWIWHGSFAKFANQAISHMAVRSGNPSGTAPERRLWIATNTFDGSATTPRLFWQSLPVTTTARQDAIVASAHRYATTWSMYCTPTNFNAPTKTARVTKAIFDTRGLAANTNTESLAISTNDTTFGSVLGTVDASSIASLDLASSAIEGSQITPLVTGVGTATAPSVLRGLTLVAGVDPNPNEVFEFDVVLSRESMQANTAANPHSTPEADYADLALMQSKFVTLTDPAGTPYTVLIETGLPGAIQEIEQSPEGTRGWGRKVSVRAIVVQRQARYGIDRYGQAVYG